jgi:hypothetical protein
VQNATCANPSYSISDIYFTIDVINVMDGMMSLMYQKMLATQPQYFQEYPYSRWSVQSQAVGASGTTIFTTNGQSLDFVVSFFSPSPASAPAFNDNKGLNTSALAGTSTYFLRPSAFNTFGSNAATNNISFELRDWQFNIGGKYLPGFPITNDITFSQNMDTIKSNRDLLGGITPTITNYIDSNATLATSSYGYVNSPYVKNYLAAYSAFLLRLNNDDEPGWITGINCSGNVLNNQFTWNGTGNVTSSALTNFVFSKCTASFIIKYGRQCFVQQ